MKGEVFACILAVCLYSTYNYDCPSYGFYTWPSYKVHDFPSYNIYDFPSYNIYDSPSYNVPSDDIYNGDICQETKDKCDDWLRIESGSREFYGGSASRAGVDFCQVKIW